MKQLIQAQGESGKADMSGKWKAGGGRELSTFHLKPAPKRRSAFTLIELIGVMAIIGILAAVTLPTMISKIEEANTANEDVMLETISEALVKAIRIYQKFPNPNVAANDASFGWATLAKDFFPGGIDAIRYVFPKDKDFALTERRVYLDPSLMAYLNANGFGLPSYGFPASDSDNPQDGITDIDEMGFRLYLVSSSKPNLTLTCAANGQTAQPAASNYNQTLITDLLNWVKAYQAPGVANAGTLIVPKTIANWSSVDTSNSRRGEYVHVKIVDLRGLMRRVVLTDYHNPMTGLGISGTFDFTPSSSGEESKTINGYLLKWENDSDGNGILDYGGKNYAGSAGNWWAVPALDWDPALSDPPGLSGGASRRFWTDSIQIEPLSRGSRVPISLFTQKESGDRDPISGRNMYRVARFAFDSTSFYQAKAPYGPFYQIGTNVVTRVTIYGNPNATGSSDETAQIDQADFYVFDGTPVRLFGANPDNGTATNGVTYPIKSNPTRFYYSQGTWTQED